LFFGGAEQAGDVQTIAVTGFGHGRHRGEALFEACVFLQAVDGGGAAVLRNLIVEQRFDTGIDDFAG